MKINDIVTISKTGIHNGKKGVVTVVFGKGVIHPQEVFEVRLSKTHKGHFLESELRPQT